MALTISHNFVSPILDQGDPTLLGPNEWNDTHAITGSEVSGPTGAIQFENGGGFGGDKSFKVVSIGNVTLGDVLTSTRGVFGFIAEDGSTVSVQAQPGTSYSVVLPVDDGNPGEVLSTDGSGNLSWASGGAAVLPEDTIKNILALTPTTGLQAYATDAQQTLVADGAQWLLDSSYSTAQPNARDMGPAFYSNRIGYGQDYVTDKLIANCRIGYGSNAGTYDGDIRFNIDIGTFGAYQQYSVGAWHNIVVGLVLTEQDDMSQAITQTPLGKTEDIVVFNGDSVLLGLNGIPIEEGYIASMGAYPVPQLVSGGTF